MPESPTLFYLGEPVEYIRAAKGGKGFSWSWCRWRDGREFLHFNDQLTCTPWGNECFRCAGEGTILTAQGMQVGVRPNCPHCGGSGDRRDAMRRVGFR